MRVENRRPYSKRCLISHRPPFRTGEPLFYRCPVCGSLTIRSTPAEQSPQSLSRTGGCEEWDSGGLEGSLAGPGGAYEGSAVNEVVCCGHVLEPLVTRSEGDNDPEHAIDFTVFGGFEENALRVLVGDGSHPMQPDHRIEWIYCRTFQGGQLKYLPERGRAAAVFAFGDEDAYVYCDRSICRMGKEHCQFCCKRGNVLYAYCSRHGLFRLEMDGIRKKSGHA